MRTSRRGAALAFTVMFALALPASAMDFSPSTTFRLHSTKARAATGTSFHLEQDAGEEELARSSIFFGRGFRFASDDMLRDGERIGEGKIVIAVGPGCAGAVGAVPTTFPASLVERDRTAEEEAGGVHAVWVLDLEFTTVKLLVSGTPQSGWTVAGDIPQNSATCPPFSFDLEVLAAASETGAAIIRNPKKPGRYVYRVTYTGTKGSTFVYEKQLRITRREGSSSVGY